MHDPLFGRQSVRLIKGPASQLIHTVVSKGGDGVKNFAPEAAKYPDSSGEHWVFFSLS